MLDRQEVDEKLRLIQLLVDDFDEMFPNSDRQTRMGLSARLHYLSVDDLKLLVSQLGETHEKETQM